MGKKIKKSIETVAYIKEFIQSMENEYKDKIRMGYQFDSLVNEYRIWHDWEDFNNLSFKETMGGKVKNILFTNDVFNFYITYDKVKARQIKNRVSMIQSLSVCMTKTISAIDTLPEPVVAYSLKRDLNFTGNFSISNPDGNFVLSKAIVDNNKFSKYPKNGQGVAAA